MRKLPNLWRALEGVPGLLAVPEVWRQESGEDFDYAKPYLQPTSRIGRRYPCPNSFSGCPRRIIDYDDDEFAAICADEHQRCDRVYLTRREALIHRLDLDGMLQPVLRAAEVRPESMTERSPGVWAVGLSEMTHARNFPVYFLLHHSASNHKAAVERLLLGVSDPFLLLLPTSQFRTVETEERLRACRVDCFCLDEQLTVDEQCRFHWVGVKDTRTATGDGGGPTPRSVGGENAVRAVREFIQTKALSQSEFAKAANLDERTVRNFFKTSKMRRSALKGVAEAMGVTLEQLLRGELPASLKPPRRR